jgi:hypothetical protein
VDTRIDTLPSSTTVELRKTSTTVELPNAPNDHPPEDAPAVESKRQPTSAGQATPHLGRTDEGEAMLHIGVVPVGQVWIDGHPAGWTPVDAKLTPGTHNIGAGDTRPEVHRYVRIRAGESRQLVLHLDETSSAGAQPGATPQLADR